MSQVDCLFVQHFTNAQPASKETFLTTNRPFTQCQWDLHLSVNSKQRNRTLRTSSRQWKANVRSLFKGHFVTISACANLPRASTFFSSTIDVPKLHIEHRKIKYFPSMTLKEPQVASRWKGLLSITGEMYYYEYCHSLDLSRLR